MFLEAIRAYATSITSGVGLPKNALLLKFEAWLAFREYVSLNEARIPDEACALFIFHIREHMPH